MNQKPFGLIVKPKKTDAPKPIVKVAAFGASDDEEDEMAAMVRGGQRQSASTIRIQKKAERIHDEAMAEDPDLYDYDSYLERKEEVKAEKEEEKKKANNGRREAKYAGKLMQAHAKRELEKQLRDERKQIKEREEEKGQFDDKEVFVTSAYKKQLELMEDFKKEQMQTDLFDEMTAVGKQKMWQQGFNRFMLENLSANRDEPSTSKSSEDKEKEKKTLQKLSRLRGAAAVEDELQLDGVSVSEKPKKTAEDAPKKPIQLADSDDEKEELQPGLNKPRIAKTRQEMIQSRFTPTPEGSSDSENDQEDSRDRRRRSRSPEGDRYRSRRRSDDRHRRRRSRSSSEEEDRPRGDSDKKNGRSKRSPSPKGSEAAKSKSPQPVKPKTKEERLEIITKILARRNTEEQIKEMRKRYLEQAAKSKSPQPVKPKTKEERLEIITKILARRNTEEQIKEMRERYLERRDQGVVPLPF
uniref:DUF2040 domain-containing protein n=1 Tax=Steinernema glaseri TaxID=37863 RepID=A0A1I7Y4E7_9BILA